jgi:hypothetical protein
MVHPFAQTFWADAKALVPFVMLARVPLLCGLALIVFPLRSLKSSLFANLFDVSPQGMIVVTLASLFTAWTTLVTGWLVLSYGHYRFDGICFQKSSELPQSIHFALSALLALPSIYVALDYSARQSLPESGRARLVIRMLIGVLVGALCGGALLRLAQRLFQDAVWRPGPISNVATFVVKLLALCAGSAGYFENGKLLQGHLLSVILFSLTLILYAVIGFLHYAPRWLRVPTLTYVLLLIMLTCWTFSGITFAADRWRVPVVLLLGIWLAITAQLPNTDHF